MTKLNKSLIIGGVLIVAVGAAILLYFLLGKTAPTAQFSVEAKNGDITEKINLTGQVKSSQGIDLAFEGQGKVIANYVKAGDKVSAGQNLAALDASSLAAQLDSAKAGLESAQASYDKLINGSTTTNIQTVQDSVDLANQDLSNAYTGAINILNDAYTKIYNAYNAVTSLQNTYFSTADQPGIAVQDGRNNINSKMTDVKSIIDSATGADTIDSAVSGTIADLNSVYDSLQIIRKQCDEGIYQFEVTSADKTSMDTQKTNINVAVTGVTSLQQNIASLKIALRKAQDQLALTKTPARPEDIALAQAQIDSANANIESIKAQISKTVITALFDGKVDKDNVVVGAISSPGVPVMTISNSSLEIDTYIPEVDLGKAKIGSKADVTLDAYANGTIFPATIISIDTAPTSVGGISAYAAKLKFDNPDSRINSGMTANINIISDTHTNVLLIPKSAVIQKNNQYFVIVAKGNSGTETRQVTVGLEDDQNIEITSGLKLGEKVLVY